VLQVVVRGVLIERIARRIAPGFWPRVASGTTDELRGEGYLGALAANDRGHLALADWSPNNQASIAELSSSSAVRVGQWELPAPSGTRGWSAQGIGLDLRGNVYVSDILGSRILQLVFPFHTTIPVPHGFTSRVRPSPECDL
jgi:hypothetical protein